MKKSHLLFLFLAVSWLPNMALATTSWVKNGEPVDLRKSANPFYNSTATTVTLNGKEYRLGSVNGSPVATRNDEDEYFDIIRDPQGKARIYTKNSAGTAMLGNNIVLYKDEFPATIVWGNNDDVYVKDILSTVPTDSYVKGTLEGSTITFKAGQVVDYIEDGPYLYGLAVGLAKTEYEYDEELGDVVNFYYDPNLTEYSMTVSQKGNLELVLPGEPFNGEDPTEYVLCLYYTDDLQFAYYSDFFQTYKPENFQIITLPEGVETENYAYIDEFDYASFVEVAYTDNYIYIKGLNPQLPEGVVRAKIDGDKAYIAQNEYMGVYMGIFYIFTKIWLDNPDYDEELNVGKPYLMAPASQEFGLTIDREKGTITADTPGVYLSFQPDENSFANSLCFLGEFVLRYQYTMEGTPANPTHLQYLTKWVPQQGFADLQFNFSNYSTEGLVLDSNHLYYSVIANDKPIIFGEQKVLNLLGKTVDAYSEIPDKQMWVPYLFSNFEDIYKYSNSEFDIGIYVWNVVKIGVQTMYNYNDEFTYSDIVTLDVYTGEITETPAAVKVLENSKVVKEEYYTLSGQKVEKPSGGIFIKRTIFNDGTVTSSKHILR